MRALDQAAKWAAVLVALGFLYAYWERRDIGRFVPESDSSSSVGVIDTKTGMIYFCGNLEACGAVDPINARTVRKEIPKQSK